MMLNLARKIVVSIFVLFALAYGARGQSAIVYRAFNAAHDSCSDSATTIIYQTNVTFAVGTYKCVANAYVAVNLTGSGNISGTLTPTIVPYALTSSTLSNSNITFIAGQNSTIIGGSTRAVIQQVPSINQVLLGDVNAVGNGTEVSIDDTAGLISLIGITHAGTTTSRLVTNESPGIVTIGDDGDIGNGAVISVNNNFLNGLINITTQNTGGNINITTTQAGLSFTSTDVSLLAVNLSLAATNGVILGNAGSTPIKKHLSVTATLAFANQASIGCNDLTITVTGAALGDTVAIGVPNGSVPNGTAFFTGWVSAANTVKVRYCNLVSGAPASGTFRADVWQH